MSEYGLKSTKRMTKRSNSIISSTYNILRNHIVWKWPKSTKPIYEIEQKGSPHGEVTRLTGTQKKLSVNHTKSSEDLQKT